MISGDVTLIGLTGIEEIVDSGYHLSPHFTAGEMACSRDRIVKLHTAPYQNFLIWLEMVRQCVGKPLILTSACRTPIHNKAEGGHPRSLHLTNNPVHPTNGCLAVDINISTWAQRKIDMLVDIILNPCFNGSVGHGEERGFIHADMRTWIGLKQTEFWYE